MIEIVLLAVCLGLSYVGYDLCNGLMNDIFK